jgi:hypothetical protein
MLSAILFIVSYLTDSTLKKTSTLKIYKTITLPVFVYGFEGGT